jgi:hypothetical protein
VERRLFDCVLAQEKLENTALVHNYRLRGAEPVTCDTRALRSQGYEVMLAPLQGARPSATLRHDSRSVALAVMRFYKRHRREG